MMPENLDISFIIITNGNRDGLLNTVIEGIKYQNIPNYEIVIVGNSKIKNNFPEVNYIEAGDLADEGLLGAMRTVACAKARYDNMVVSDDDMMLSSNWYEELQKAEDFDILTTQVRNPDGTRFWDHTCFRSPTFGHIVMEKEECDEKYMYMSGGQSWIMKKRVFEKAKWNEDFSTGYRANMRNLKDYHEGKGNEDTDFSERCIKSGFKIKHNHSMISYHCDPSYTCVGRIVKRRFAERTHQWVRGLDKYFPPEIYAGLASSLYSMGLHAESADVVRYALNIHKQNHTLIQSMNVLLSQNGNILSDDQWSENGYDSYNKDLNTYRMNSEQFYNDH